MCEIIHSCTDDEPYFVINKKRNIPSAPLFKDDFSAYTQLQKQFPFLDDVHGKKEIEHGLIHRIDNETEGLILIASEQNFYDEMISLQKDNCFVKHYTALCEPFFYTPDSKEFPVFNDSNLDVKKAIETKQKISISSKFRPFGKGNGSVRPVNEFSGKAALKKCGKKNYSTQIEFGNTVFFEEKKLVEVHCSITQGYRHQVRCHLAWLGLPVHGDRLYNVFCSEKDSFCFTASSFEFTYMNKIKKYSIVPDFLEISST